MFRQFVSYKKLNRSIIHLIAAETCIQLINSAFMLALLVYMEKQGYEDYVSAHFQKYRFLIVLALAIPIGIYIRGRKIKPLFFLSSFLVPASALLILYSLENKIEWLIYLSHISWGTGFVFMQVSVIPFILRHTAPEAQTEAISLSHSTWSMAGIITGVVFFSFQYLMPQWFNEKIVMQIFAVAGFFALYFVVRIKVDEENFSVPKNRQRNFFDYDWGIITVAMIPTTLIATGAGLTVPFIGLFFYKIHGIDTDTFSLLACIALFFVSFSTLLVPQVKKKLGYLIAIPLTQGISILSLLGLASTEWFSFHYMAPVLAAIFYIARQPLMNMAAPMTSDVTMHYVGEKNREMVSALTASVWSGGWFLSSWCFEYLRIAKFSFAAIFIITAVFYTVGVFAYHLLTVDCNKKGRLPR